jgi:hypothetical protein
MSRHRGYTVVELAAWVGDDRPDATDTERYGAAVATVSVRGRDGWTGPVDHYTVYCTLQRTGTTWRIGSYELEAS